MSNQLDNAIARFNRITSEIFDNGLQAIDAINCSLGMIADAEKQARNEMHAAKFTDCKACQASIVIFLNDTPDAPHESINAVTKHFWENCNSCQSEYDAWLCSTYAPDDDALLDCESDWEKCNLWGGA